MPFTIRVGEPLSESGQDEITATLEALDPIDDVFVEADGTVSVAGDVDPERVAEVVDDAGYTVTY